MKLIYQGTLSPVNFPTLKGGFTIERGGALELSPADFGGDLKAYEDKVKELIASGNFREYKEYKPAPDLKTNTSSRGTLTRKKNR